MKRRLCDILLDLVFPPKCASCGNIVSSGEVLCEECLAEYSDECRAAESHDSDEPCRLEEYVKELIYLTTYKGYYSELSGVTEKLVYSLKHRRSVPLADFFARDISSELLKRITVRGEVPGNYVLVFLPRGERNLEKYGFDHAKLLADRISRYTGLQVAEPFVRHGGAEQKKMNSLEREANVSRTLGLSRDFVPDGRGVILVDDVVTTGATAQHAAELLRSCGVKDVWCAVIAKTEHK